MERLLLRPEECAAALGLGRSKIYELMAAGHIESLKIGRRRLVPSAAVLDFVRRQREEQGDLPPVSNSVLGDA